MADPVAEMRLADTNRRKAAILKGVPVVFGDSAALVMFSPGSTLRAP
jgi:hypothetical protein